MSKQEKQQRREERKALRAKADQEMLKRRLMEKHWSPHFVHDPRTSKTRSIIKTASYRVISWASTVALAAWLVPVYGPAAFASVDAVGNTALYYGFERMWAHIELWADKRKETVLPDK